MKEARIRDFLPKEQYEKLKRYFNRKSDPVEGDS